MVRLLLLTALLGAAAPTDAHANLRVMTPVELASNAIIVARARVLSVDESDWGNFRQIAKLELVDVIEGDFTIGEVRVAARSLVAYTNDRYAKKEEWLVFLWHDAGFYRTVNYQYGQFRIENEVVKGWRNAENVASDRPYYSVREEIEQIYAGIRAPVGEDPQPAAAQPQQLQQAPPAARPRPSANRPPPTVIRPE
jgi:hypothetical protein